jgi:phage anti-repressor protein
MKTNQPTITRSSVTELIPISEHHGKRAVSARDLHNFLESKTRFNDWISRRIEEYGLIENQDFEVLLNFEKNPSGGRPSNEYALSMDCAKELAMVEGNARGKQARQYFIACEQKLKEASKTLTSAEQLLMQAQVMVEQEKRISTIENKLHVLEARTTTHPEFFTIAGYATLHHTPVNLKQAAVLGRRASLLCQARGIETDRMPDPRFGEVKMYPTAILNEVFETSLTLNH